MNFGKWEWGWGKRNALAYLKALEYFEFVYVLISLHKSLLSLKEATVKLQGQSEDIGYGITTIQRCCAELKTLRADVDSYIASMSTVVELLSDQGSLSQCHV